TRTILAELARQPRGRVYAGLRSNWGQTLDFGIPFNSVRFYNLFAHYELDAVAPPNQSLSFNADLLWLFNVDYVIAPRSVTFPSDLRVLASTAKYVLYAAPGRGYAEYAAITHSESV